MQSHVIRRHTSHFSKTVWRFWFLKTNTETNTNPKASGVASPKIWRGPKCLILGK